MSTPCLSLFLLLANVVLADLPLVDFDRMGKVGLAGTFAGLDLFQTSSSVSFDAQSSTLLSRQSDGSLSPLASTNQGGRVSAGCLLDDTFYFAGSFSSIDSLSASNIASYSSTSGDFAPLGDDGPNGQIDALYCDQANSRLWVGGSFTSPSSAVAVWDPEQNSWSPPPFVGLTGADARVFSITPNISVSSLVFAGSFLTSFRGNGSAVLNGTNNPNVPFSAGATPFSSSLVPIPLSNAEIGGSPSSSDSNFADINSILCPAGDDGPGNTWFAADGNEAVVTVRTFSFISATGVRLGNTFQEGHGTTSFSVTTIPDNTVRTLQYLDPTTNENQTCSDSCPLSTDSSLLYQDFLFDGPQSITGLQIRLFAWTGSGAGLHLLQLLSSGAFASSVDEDNSSSCYAPHPSNTTRTGDWTAKVANTNISGTVQTVLVSNVNVGTAASDGPSFTWIPYVSASGNYEVRMLVPGCTNFQDCPLRTSVKVTVFPGDGIDPWVSTISQTNTEDASTVIYSGPILPSSPNFVTTISMTLADDPEGEGQGGQYELIADRIQLILTSANATESTSGANGNVTGATSVRSGFGFFEWPFDDGESSADATSILPNSTQTALDVVGFSLFSALGGNSSFASSTSSAVAAVAHHSSGAVFLGGNFSLSGGTASNGQNLVVYKDGAISNVAGNGLNGAVSAMVLDGDNLFIGGSFDDTSSGSMDGKLQGVALYSVSRDQWTAMGGGVNGRVSSIGFMNGQVQVVGNFTERLSSDSTTSSASGLAVWDTSKSEWVNSGGYLAGSMTFIGNGTSETQFIAGNVVASSKFGATGLVLLQNGDGDLPEILPLTVQLDGLPSGRGSSTASRRRSVYRHARSLSSRSSNSWFSQVPRISLGNFWRRQSSSELAPLPTPPATPAPAVLSGAFWTNSSSSVEVIVIGGNFSFASGSSGVAIYDPESSSLTALQGSQINGTVRSLLVDGDSLYIGGEFTLSDMNANGFAVYNLATQQWDTSNVQAFSSSSGSNVVVRSITKSTARENTVVVAGSFAQVGSLRCQSICFLDTSSKQWNALGGGIQGEVSSVVYAGENQDVLIAAGSIALADNNGANVAQFYFSNDTWAAVGSGGEIPGPVTAVEVNNGNSSSIFAAGSSTDGTSFLIYYDGQIWSALSSTLQDGSVIAQLAMVPLQDTHEANGIIEPDRMLMVSGLLESSSFGNASSALFDGSTLIPYISTTSATGAAGLVSALFRSFSSFSFNQRKFFATGVVILISIAIAAGVVFLLALIGILWTLFSRRDEKATKLDVGDEDDDESTHHRPSSLLEHINAATRNTIYGGSPFVAADKEEEKVGRDQPSPTPDHDDPFGPDASNYLRAETPSDMMGGLMGEEYSRPAHARYSFDAAGEGELPLTAGAEVEVLDDRDAAWWYARDVRTGQEGVVPAAYLY